MHFKFCMFLIILLCFPLNGICENWPKKSENSTVTITVGQFQFEVPSEWTGADVYNNWIHRINYANSSITFSLNKTKKNFESEEIFNNSKFSTNDFPSLLIKSQEMNPSLESSDDKKIWNEALTLKKLWFGEAEGKVFEKGNLLAYYGRPNFEGITSSAILASYGNSDFIQILGRNISEDMLLNIIASFNVREGE